MPIEYFHSAKGGTLLVRRNPKANDKWRCTLLCSPQHTILGKEGCLRETRFTLGRVVSTRSASRSPETNVGFEERKHDRRWKYDDGLLKRPRHESGRESDFRISTHLPNPFTPYISTRNRLRVEQHVTSSHQSLVACWPKPKAIPLSNLCKGLSFRMTHPRIDEFLPVFRW